MKIKTVLINGLKGQERKLELTGRDFLVGPNGAGKSAVLESIEILRRGCLERLGKQVESTLTLAANGSINLGLETESGFSITRTFGRVKGKATQALEVFPSRGERKVDEKEARIQKEMGPGTTIFDFTEFLQASPAKRVAWFLQFADEEKAKEIFQGFVAEHQESMKGRDVLEPGKPVIEQVSLIYEGIKSDRLTLTREIKKNKEASETLAQKRLALQTASLDEAGARKRGDEAQTEIGRLDEQKRRWQTSEERRSAQVKRLAAIKGSIASTEKELEGKKALLASSKDPQAEINEATEKMWAAGKIIGDAQKVHATEQERARGLKREDEDLDKREKALKGAGKKGECPLCLAQLGANSVAMLFGDIKSRREEIQKEIVSISSKIRHLEEEIAKAEKAKKEGEQRVADSRKKAVVIEKAKKELADDQAAINSSKATAVEIEQFLGQQSLEAWAEEQEQALRGARQAATEAKAEESRIRERRAIEKAFQEIQVALTESDERQTVLAELEEAIGPKGLLARVATECLEAFTGQLKRILPTVAIDADFRMTYNGSDLRTLSGGETARVVAGILAAIAIYRGDANKTLLIEAGEIDADNLVSLLEALQGIAEIDNIIVATCHHIMEERGGAIPSLQGWTCWSLLPPEKK